MKQSEYILSRFIRLAIVVVTVTPWLATTVLVSPAQARPEDEPIFYSRSVAHDPAGQLQKKIESGEVAMEPSDQHGYLESLLKALNVPVSSQMLVLSKTSFQSNLITPHRPRALYFNDETYIGFVQDGSVLEVISIDPNLGAVFYLMKQHTARPRMKVRQKFRVHAVPPFRQHAECAGPADAERVFGSGRAAESIWPAHLSPTIRARLSRPLGADGT